MQGPGAAAGATPADGWEQVGAREPTTILRAALRPRMLALLVLFLGAGAVCARLGVWQLDRAQVRGESSQEVVAEQLADADPVPLEDVLAPQTTFTGAALGRKVEVEGVYDAAGQLLVPGREHDGTTGSLVLTPLRVTLDDGSEAVLPVVRGWVASAQDAGAPPAGSVGVVGYLQVSEAPGDGIGGGETDAVSSAVLVGEWGGPIWTGYVLLESSDPAQDASVVVVEPEPRDGGGLNIQNLAYAAQWWIFGGFAVLLWLRMVRDEAHGGRRPGAAGGAGTPPGDGPAAAPTERSADAAV